MKNVMRKIKIYLRRVCLALTLIILKIGLNNAFWPLKNMTRKINKDIIGMKAGDFYTTAY
jgi:ribosomal protein S19